MLTVKQCRVKPMTKLTAVSSKPSESGQSYPLSALDHAMGLHTATVIFYYEENPFGSFILDPLRESLSKVLTLYPKVTGRITRTEEGNWAVKGNDAGVRVTMTKVGATLEEWLRSADWAEERDLAVLEEMPDDPYIWSQFRIQINKFEGGGVAIGVSFTHLNADPTSATFLIKAWADDSHHGDAVLRPLFTRPSAGDDKQVSNVPPKSNNYYANKSKPTTSHAKMASVTFKFTLSTIHQCLSEIGADCPDATPFDLLAALFWTRLMLIKASKTDQHCSLSICTDFRKLYQFPLHRYYFGNALHFSQLSVNPEEIEQCGLGHVAGLLHRHVQRLAEEEGKEIRSAMEWIELQKEEGGKYMPPFKMYGPELTCVSMEHTVDGSESLMYATKFVRDSKPVHVSYNVGNAEGEGLIVVTPSNEGGVARNVMVMLPERELAELCEDHAILSLQPTLILGGSQS